MTRQTALVWAAVLAAIALYGWFRLAGAGERLRTAQAQAAAQQRDLDRLVALRGRGPAPGQGRRPQDDLVGRAQRALAAAGLPVAACSGVQPRADQVADGLRLQTVQLRLQGLRPVEFAAWLAAWSTPDQPWRMSELQMVHAATSGATALDSNRFDLTIILTAPYLEDRP
jgi:hypothetical protein